MPPRIRATVHAKSLWTGSAYLRRPSMPSAILFDHPGPPAVLHWRPVASLTPLPHEVVIGVQAAGVNNADVLQRRGHYPVPPGAPRPLGLECAGTVTAIGSNVTGWSP